MWNNTSNKWTQSSPEGGKFNSIFYDSKKKIPPKRRGSRVDVVPSQQHVNYVRQPRHWPGTAPDFMTSSAAPFSHMKRFTELPALSVQWCPPWTHSQYRSGCSVTCHKIMVNNSSDRVVIDLLSLSVQWIVNRNNSLSSRQNHFTCWCC